MTNTFLWMNYNSQEAQRSQIGESAGGESRKAVACERSEHRTIRKENEKIYLFTLVLWTKLTKK